MAGEIANSILSHFLLVVIHYLERSIGMSTEWRIDGGTMHRYIVMVLFDINCWVLSSLQANQPLYKYIGAYRDQVPIYGSSLVYKAPEDYAKEAKEYKDRGFNAYKIHPPGNYELDLEIHKAARSAVGDDFKLMSDPVAPYTFEQALRLGES